MVETTSPGSKATKVAAIGLILFILNCAYLASFTDPTYAQIINILLHCGLGLLLAAGLRIYLRREWSRLPATGRIGIALFIVSSLIGLAIMLFGATRQWFGFGKAVKWAGPVHLAVGVAAVILMTSWILQKRTAWPLYARIFALTVLVSLILPPVASQYLKRTRANTDYIVNPTSPPLSMDGEGQGPGGPFFPSSAETNTGGTVPAKFFLSSESCARCHKEIYDQWNSSAHHFASFNNQWYRKSIEYMQDTIGTGPSKWCAGCHDHAVLFAGKFDTPIKQQINTPEAQAGLGCVSCHAIAHVKSSMGQADFEIEYPSIHALADSDNIEPADFESHMLGAPAAMPSMDELYDRVVSGHADFWRDVYQPFMDRDLNRTQVRALVRKAFDAARWNYRRLVEVLRVPSSDYQRFMDFLRHHNLKPGTE